MPPITDLGDIKSTKQQRLYPQFFFKILPFTDFLDLKITPFLLMAEATAIKLNLFAAADNSD